MELIFQAGELDEFYEAENKAPLAAAVATAGVMEGCSAALRLVEWHTAGTTRLTEQQRQWQLRAFFCCGVILEAVLLDDGKRRALASIHDQCVNIGIQPASSYHEAIYNLVRLQVMLQVECENNLGPHLPKYGRAPSDFSELRTVSFRLFGGFVGVESPQGWLANVSAELVREADLANGQIPQEQLTLDQQRMQFCFSEWQAGKTYKEINVALKAHAVWDHFDDEKAVRGPIHTWAKRIGVEPRKGQPGRQPKSARRK